MSSIHKSLGRDRKILKRSRGPIIDSRSVFLIEELQRKRAEKAKRKIERQLHKEVEEKEDD
ncbi:TPA: hypothetical protein DCQ22_04195 [Candidatus Nomurabacteria bacterium]|nr:hypothetical protein [Candidatus Nomurabacteria bacterium]